MMIAVTFLLALAGCVAAKDYSSFKPSQYPAPLAHPSLRFDSQGKFRIMQVSGMRE